MNDLLIAAAGIAAIAWVNWYFFFAGAGTAAATVSASGVQEVTVQVLGGYSPAQVIVRAGTPVRFHFDRQETSGCSEEIVFPDFGVKRFLPAFRTTDIDLPSMTPGSYEFTCGMGMLRGKLIVEEGGAEG